MILQLCNGESSLTSISKCEFLSDDVANLIPETGSHEYLSSRQQSIFYLSIFDFRLYRVSYTHSGGPANFTVITFNTELSKNLSGQ